MINPDISVECYNLIKQISPSEYHGIVLQYRDMSRGGEGGRMGYTPRDWSIKAQRHGINHDPRRAPTVRQYRYHEVPDSYFDTVLKGLGEK